MNVSPFEIDVPPPVVADLRERLARTRWPEPEPVGDWSQGVPLAVVRELCRYWQDGYDWPSRQARLNAAPQFVTGIDGLDIHFVHARSPHPDARPLVITHGWPGCFAEYLDLVGPLTDPVAFGGDERDAFHVVLPSLPGYAFSGRPAEPGWNVSRIAGAWAELMSRLGYHRFGAAGSDWGTSVSASLGAQFPDRLTGLHLIPPLAAPDPATFDDLTPDEEAALADLEHANARESGYSAIMATKPQTVGYGLVDSPAALCGWLLEKFWAWTDRRAVAGGDLYELIDRDRVLDIVSIYWLTGTGASAARLYRESFEEIWAIFNGPPPDRVDVPVGASIFPKEVPRASRRWAGRRFSDIRQWHELDSGGHFAALEQPALVLAELRSFFRLLDG